MVDEPGGAAESGVEPARRSLRHPNVAGRDEAVEGDAIELATVVGEAERRAILRALAASGDNKAAAAALLGIGERTLWTKLKKHGV